jgi:hypothetical protein
MTFTCRKQMTVIYEIRYLSATAVGLVIHNSFFVFPELINNILSFSRVIKLRG